MNTYLTAIRIPNDWTTEHKLQALQILDLLHTGLTLPRNSGNHPSRFTRYSNRNRMLEAIYNEISCKEGFEPFFFASTEYHNWLQTVMDAFVDLF
jgi:hypothetical protein